MYKSGFIFFFIWFFWSNSTRKHIFVDFLFFELTLTKQGSDFHSRQRLEPVAHLTTKKVQTKKSETTSIHQIWNYVIPDL
jgi:hypothetical protein